MVDRDKLIFVQIDQIMQALATRLDKCHEELQQYYLQYVNPSVEYSSSSSTSNDDLNGNFMAISTSVPNQPITDKEKLVSSFQMPQISWNMETIMDDESLTPKTNTERKTKEKEKENKKFKKNKNKNKNLTMNDLDWSNRQNEVLGENNIIVETEEKEFPMEDVSSVVKKNRYQVIADVNIELISIFVDLCAWKAKIQKVVSEPHRFL